MSFVGQVAALRTRAGEPRGNGLTVGSGLSGLMSSLSSAGRTVTADNAIGLSAVWACVWLLGEQGASIPLRDYVHQGDGELQPAPGGVSARWLSQPNPECSPMDLWSTAIVHMELWGEAFIGKEKALGRVVNKWLIHPSRVAVRREKGQKLFDVIEDDGSSHTYTTADILHIKGRSLDGLRGASTIHIHRNSLGVALALDDMAGDTFRDRGIPPGILTVKKRIDDPKVKDEMRDEWDARYGVRHGRGKRKIAILDEDARFEAIAMPLDDAQFIEQRRYSDQDIARIFGLAPEDIGSSSGSSMDYTSVQQRRADLLQLRLWPRLNRIVGALRGDPDLYPPARGIVPNFDDTGFVRGDPKEQFETLRVATGNKPILTQDEARGMVGKKALGGTAGELDHKSTPTGNVAGGPATKEA